jgi:hypothetical protein
MPTTPFIRAPWQTPQGIFRELLVAPALAVSRQEAKIVAGLTWPDGDPREGMLDLWIRAAQAKVEQDTGLALLSQSWRLTFETWTSPGILPLPSQAMPLISIVDVNGDPLPDWTIVRGLLVLPVGTLPLVVTIVSGWPDPDALRAEAPLLLHAVSLLVAHYATTGRDVASDDSPDLVPLGYDEAIGPYRLIWVP